MADADELRVLLTAKDELSSKLKDVRATVRALERDMAAANAEFKQTGDASALNRYQDLYRDWERATKAQKEYAAQLRRANASVRSFGKESTVQARQVQSRWDSAFAKMAAGAAAAFSVQAVVDFGRQSVLAFADAEKQQRKLQFAYEEFPALADVSITALQELNSEMMRKTGIDDDALAAGEAMLAQFELTGSQIRDVVPLLADYAAWSGKSVPDAAGMLGKALMGNTRALKAVGIDYKATGDRAADYAEVVDRLREKVGGFAEQEAQTAAGALKRLEAMYGELQESIGEVLVPVMEAGLPILQTYVDQFKQLSGPVSQVARDLGELIPQQSGVNTKAQEMLDWLPSAAAGFGLVGLAANQLRYTAEYLAGDGLDGVAEAAVRAAGGLRDTGSAITPLMGQFDVTGDAAKRLGRALSGLTGAIDRWQALRAYRKALRDYVDKPSLDTADAVTAAMETAAESFKKPKAAVKFTNQAIKSIRTAVAQSGIDDELRDRLLAQLDKAAAKVGRVKDDLAGLDGAQVTVSVLTKKLGGFFASGGLVVGPGTGTSDSIPAQLSNGEYVVRASAVRAVGVETLERINRADYAPVPPIVVKGGDGASVTVPSGHTVNIGTIQAQSGVDVQGEVLHAMLRADRIARERR